MKKPYPPHAKKERHYFALRRQSTLLVAQGRGEKNEATAKELLTIAIHNYVVKNMPEIVKQAIALPVDAKRCIEPISTEF